ncbi:MAG: hypothetical protein K2L02_04260 [Clostridia bacterium]|nr:hypothetical protein [Clostridia bacterium]
MRERNSKVRLEQMLERDKEEMNEASKRAALADLERVAGEYFDLDNGARLSIKRVKGAYEVNLTFRAVRVKNFSVLQ